MRVHCTMYILRSDNFESKFSCAHLTQKPNKIIFFISALASTKSSNQKTLSYNYVKKPLITLESGINITLRLLFFGNFSRGYSLITDLKDSTLLHKFAHFRGLRFFFLSNFLEATLIQGATSIP